MDKAQMLVTVLVTLSMASERLVEAIKGLLPWLNMAKESEAADGPRRSVLLFLSFGAGVLSAFLGRDLIHGAYPDFDPNNVWSIVGLGILSSAGSGFWNAILTYLLKLKDLKEIAVQKAKPQPAT